MAQKKPKPKRSVGRPSKMIPELIQVLSYVVENFVYATDEEFVFILNLELEKQKLEEHKISLDTFKSYKEGKRGTDNSLYTEFVRLIREALLRQKMTLLANLAAGSNQWQARAWILERKFKEWRLVNQTELSGPDGKPLEVKNTYADVLNAVKKLDDIN